MIRAALLALLLTGCATNGLTVYQNGPVTYKTGPREAVIAECVRILATVPATLRRGSGPGAPWCVRWTETTLTVACPEGEERECWVHELRHYVDKDWTHPEGTR